MAAGHWAVTAVTVGSTPFLLSVIALFAMAASCNFVMTFFLPGFSASSACLPGYHSGSASNLSLHILMELSHGVPPPTFWTDSAISLSVRSSFLFSDISSKAKTRDIYWGPKAVVVVNCGALDLHSCLVPSAVVNCSREPRGARSRGRDDVQSWVWNGAFLSVCGLGLESWTWGKISLGTLAWLQGESVPVLPLAHHLGVPGDAMVKRSCYEQRSVVQAMLRCRAA